MADATSDRQTVSARFPEAEAVFVVGQFNRWSTTATPMHRRADGIWEAQIPRDVVPGTFAFFVWQPGALGGRLQRGEAHWAAQAQI